MKKKQNKNSKQGSYMRGIVLLAQAGKSEECAALFLQAETHYFNRVQNALTPFPTDDTAILVCVLRDIASQLERSTTEAKRNTALAQACYVPITINLNYKNKEVK